MDKHHCISIGGKPCFNSLLFIVTIPNSHQKTLLVTLQDIVLILSDGMAL